MWHKIKNILLWLLLAAYLVVALGFAAANSEKVVCSNVSIEVTNNNVNQFMKTADINRMLEQNNIKMKGRLINEINTWNIEQIINTDPAVRKTAVYSNLKGEMVIEVTQCRPIVRVINNNLRQYYIDENAVIVPYKQNYFAHTLVANGFIPEPFDVGKSIGLMHQKQNNGKQHGLIFDLYQLAKFIDNNEFWRAQIQQVYVNANRELELIPRVGAHVILFGDASNIEYKFKKLKSVYRIFNQTGWNNYKTINLKFNDQVICTKR